jgi:hypothetical protein
MAYMLVDHVSQRTLKLIVAGADSTEVAFAPLAGAIQTDVEVTPRIGGDNNAERSEAISAAVATRINARGVSRAPAAMPG